MPALTVGGVDISLSRADAPVEYEEIGGDRARMDDGTMRELEPTRKRVWGPLATVLLSSAQESTQRAALIAAPPITCAGDVLGGSVSCHVQLHGSDRVPTVAGVRYRLRFTIFER
jgi:hypothetical protein